MKRLSIIIVLISFYSISQSQDFIIPPDNADIELYNFCVIDFNHINENSMCILKKDPENDTLINYKGTVFFNCDSIIDIECHATIEKIGKNKGIFICKYIITPKDTIEYVEDLQLIERLIYNNGESFDDGYIENYYKLKTIFNKCKSFDKNVKLKILEKLEKIIESLKIISFELDSTYDHKYDHMYDSFRQGLKDKNLFNISLRDLSSEFLKSIIKNDKLYENHYSEEPKTIENDRKRIFDSFKLIEIKLDTGRYNEIKRFRNDYLDSLNKDKDTLQYIYALLTNDERYEFGSSEAQNEMLFKNNPYSDFDKSFCFIHQSGLLVINDKSSKSLKSIEDTTCNNPSDNKSKGKDSIDLKKVWLFRTGLSVKRIDTYRSWKDTTNVTAYNKSNMYKLEMLKYKKISVFYKDANKKIIEYIKGGSLSYGNIDEYLENYSYILKHVDNIPFEKVFEESEKIKTVFSINQLKERFMFLSEKAHEKEQENFNDVMSLIGFVFSIISVFYIVFTKCIYLSTIETTLSKYDPMYFFILVIGILTSLILYSFLVIDKKYLSAYESFPHIIITILSTAFISFVFANIYIKEIFRKLVKLVSGKFCKCLFLICM